MPSVSSPFRSANGPYRPTRDPQIILLLAIVVGVVGLWAFGVMSPATLAGGESGPVFPFRDQSEDGRVSVSVNESTIDPGDAIGVTVSVDGKPASDAMVAVAGESYETNADGSVVVRLAEPGSYDVEGTRPDGNRTASASVRVRRYEAALAVSVPSGAETGEDVPVRVERVDGGPVSATVSVGGESYATGADGVANVSLATAGEYAVRASKASTPTHRFVDATATLAVDRRPVRLRVRANESAPRVDDHVAFAVTRRDIDAPVNATLAVGNRTVATGADGVANVSFETAGAVTVSASANETPAVRYVAGDARVDVQRIPVDLSIAVAPDPLAEGQRTTVVVRRADTGERVDAFVSLYGARFATGADGRVSFPFYVPGNVTVRATKPSTDRETYRAASTTFTVDGPEIVVDSLSVPGTARANDEVTITATLSNVGTRDFAGDAVVRVGTERTRVATAIAAGETKTVAWTAETPNATGNVTVAVAVEELELERDLRLVDANATETDQLAARSPLLGVDSASDTRVRE